MLIGTINQDVAAVGGRPELIQAIEANWWKHQANWAMAGAAAMDKNSAAIQSMFDDAKAANDAVEADRKAAARPRRLSVPPLKRRRHLASS
jgi:hypothetical protein